jgi:hypothetical protein
MIVDAQVHIWGIGKPTNPNDRQVPSFIKDELLKEMDEADVDVPRSSSNAPPSTCRSSSW